MVAARDCAARFKDSNSTSPPFTISAPDPCAVFLQSAVVIVVAHLERWGPMLTCQVHGHFSGKESDPVVAQPGPPYACNRRGFIGDPLQGGWKLAAVGDLSGARGHPVLTHHQ